MGEGSNTPLESTCFQNCPLCINLAPALEQLWKCHREVIVKLQNQISEAYENIAVHLSAGIFMCLSKHIPFLLWTMLFLVALVVVWVSFSSKMETSPEVEFARAIPVLKLKPTHWVLLNQVNHSLFLRMGRQESGVLLDHSSELKELQGCISFPPLEFWLLKDCNLGSENGKGWL